MGAPAGAPFLFVVVMELVGGVWGVVFGVYVGWCYETLGDAYVGVT